MMGESDARTARMLAARLAFRDATRGRAVPPAAWGTVLESVARAAILDGTITPEDICRAVCELAAAWAPVVANAR